MGIKNNTTLLNEILDTVNGLPTGSGGSSGGVDISDATAITEQVLSPAVFYNNEGRQVGTMPNNGAVVKELGFGESTTIAKGYHDGNGSVSAQALPTLTNPADAAKVLSGYQAINASGGVVTGTHTCPTVADLTADADATAGDIAQGKTAYVNGVKVVGSLVPPKVTKVNTTITKNTTYSMGSIDSTKNYLLFALMVGYDKYCFTYITNGDIKYYKNESVSASISGGILKVSQSFTASAMEHQITLIEV